jgi:hypothetical protein
VNNAKATLMPMAAGAPSSNQEEDMTEHSKSRIQADAAFSKLQTRFLSRERTKSNADNLNEVRDANTAKLKEQRLAKEALDSATSGRPRLASRKSIKGS